MVIGVLCFALANAQLGLSITFDAQAKQRATYVTGLITITSVLFSVAVIGGLVSLTCSWIMLSSSSGRRKATTFVVIAVPVVAATIGGTAIAFLTETQSIKLWLFLYGHSLAPIVLGLPILLAGLFFARRLGYRLLPGKDAASPDT
jgi:hypothetical protein